MALTFLEVLDDLGKLTMRQAGQIVGFVLALTMIFFLLLHDLNTAGILALVSLAAYYMVRKDQEAEQKKTNGNHKPTPRAGAAASARPKA